MDSSRRQRREEAAMKIKYLALAVLTGFTCVEATAQSAPPEGSVQGVPPGLIATPINPKPAQSAPPRKDIPAIAKTANGAIVTIITANSDKPIAQGTGFLVSADGVIVTNYHVIETGNVALVKFPDGTVLPVDGVLAADKVRDLAVIKIHGKTFRTLTLGNSDRVQVGEEVVAIGNPLSLESTVSNGIISGVRTSKEQGGKFLQTTAPISPGSSGGPLFNMAGEVVGINTLYLAGGENLNFAIPVNDAKNLLSTKSAKLHNLPNEQPSENASSAEGKENSNDLKKQLEQIEWMQATRGHRDEKSDELRETLQWMQDTLPEGSSECDIRSKQSPVCFTTELRKLVGCKVEFNLPVTIWLYGRAMPDSYHPSFNYYLDLGNLDPERILSKNVHDDSHEYVDLSLHTWNDTNKIFHVEVPTNELLNELTLHLKADYSLRLEKAFRHVVDLCGGKPSTVKF
jgi:S1-C subfamily serine protease